MVGERPFRDRLEERLDNIPSGPLGKAGEGDLVGAGGFLAIESTRPIIDFIPGVKQPGYHITAHSTEMVESGVERHTITVTAFSEDVAEFAAQYFAAPSNFDYLSSDIELIDTEVEIKRPSYSTYKVTVDLIQ